MEKTEKIEVGNWVQLKSNPEIRIKVEKINSNNTVDFRERCSDPQYAYLDELEKITDEELLRELQMKDI